MFGWNENSSQKQAQPKKSIHRSYSNYDFLMVLVLTILFYYIISNVKSGINFIYNKAILTNNNTLVSKNHKQNFEKDIIIDNLRKIIADNKYPARIEKKTGEVTLFFNGIYFDFGSTKLKEKMKDDLNKFIPLYAKALFADPKLKKKIRSIEIIGNSSPIYKGQYYRPKSLESIAATNFNMDLSYQRAKSIFQYIFDTRKIKFKYQKEMLKLTKVTGCSAVSKFDNSLKSVSETTKKGRSLNEICKEHKCNKQQKVTIKFELY